MRLLLLAPFLLAACQSESQIADANTVSPPISVMSETPGDWSELDGLVGRIPAESGLLQNSPVEVDLNAKLGPALREYRQAMGLAGPLERQDKVLVTQAPDAFLVLDPADHAFRAGLRRNGRWQEWTTAASEVPRPR